MKLQSFDTPVFTYSSHPRVDVDHITLQGSDDPNGDSGSPPASSCGCAISFSLPRVSTEEERTREHADLQAAHTTSSQLQLAEPRDVAPTLQGRLGNTEWGHRCLISKNSPGHASVHRSQSVDLKHRSAHAAPLLNLLPGLRMITGESTGSVKVCDSAQTDPT